MHSRSTRLVHLNEALRIQQEGLVSEELQVEFLRSLTYTPRKEKDKKGSNSKKVSAAAAVVIAESEHFERGALHTTQFLQSNGKLPSEEIQRRAALISEYPGMGVWFYSDTSGAPCSR